MTILISCILLLSTIGCNSSNLISDHSENNSPPPLSVVSKAPKDNSPCIYSDRTPRLRAWSDEGLVATILNDNGQVVYFTYRWEEIGISPAAGYITYGRFNGRLFFPGTLEATWGPPSGGHKVNYNSQ